MVYFDYAFFPPKVQQSLLFFKVEAYRTDPLVDHNSVKLRFVIVFGDTVEKIKQLIPSIQWPFLVIHGDDDKLTYLGGSQFLEREAKSEDKEIKVGVIYNLLEIFPERYKHSNLPFRRYFVKKKKARENLESEPTMLRNEC